MVKSFHDISWLVSEPEYREDTALSYSTLSTYQKEGFNGLSHLFDKKESESLLFGSCVDSIITGGMEEFESRFIVMDIPDVIPSIQKVIKACFDLWGEVANVLPKITDDKLLEVINDCEYQPRWRDINRIKSIRDDGSVYYKALVDACGKQVVTTAMYTDILNCVDKLKNSESTKWYFGDQEIDDFDIDSHNNIERLYQLKFKTSLDGIDYRCMADLLVVDHDAKIVYPVDLKTSSHNEWDFFKSFVEWNYQIQARLYWRIIRNIMDQDDYFKDFKLDNYRFIVVNKKTLIPLVWLFEDTQKIGTLSYHSDKIIFKDPFDIGRELRYYLDNPQIVPIGVSIDNDNSLTNWLNKDD